MGIFFICGRRLREDRNGNTIAATAGTMFATSVAEGEEEERKREERKKERRKEKREVKFSFTTKRRMNG